MAEEVKAVHREPHPFIGIAQIMNFVGRPVAFVGKIDRFEDNNMFMKTHEGKVLCRLWFCIEKEVKVIKFRGDPSRMSGTVEVRGIVNKDGTISYGEFTQYDNEFGKEFIFLYLNRPRHSWAHARVLSWYVQRSMHQVRMRSRYVKIGRSYFDTKISQEVNVHFLRMCLCF